MDGTARAASISTSRDTSPLSFEPMWSHTSLAASIRSGARCSIAWK